jgi:hypothetical protein
MTEGYQSYPATDAETQYLPPVTPAVGTTATFSAEGDSQGEQGTTEVAKEQAADLKQGTVQAGQHVASVAKEQAATVTSEAKTQAKNLLDQARSELGQQASTQQQRVADGLKSLSQELHSMSQHSDQPGPAAQLARHGAQATEQVASWFDGRDPGALVDEVRSFARRRPGTFLLLAAGAGLMAGRLTRGLKDEAGSGSEDDEYGRTSYTASGGSYTHPETAGLAGTGLAGGFATPPPAPVLDEPVPYVGQDGELGYPTTGNSL